MQYDEFREVYVTLLKRTESKVKNGLIKVYVYWPPKEEEWDSEFTPRGCLGESFYKRDTRKLYDFIKDKHEWRIQIGVERDGCGAYSYFRCLYEMTDPNYDNL